MIDGLNSACEGLRALCKRDVTDIRMHVRSDGRVEFYASNLHGHTLWVVRADLDRDSTDPPPEEALAMSGAP